jgi:hypothetical protein
VWVKVFNTREVLEAFMLGAAKAKADPTAHVWLAAQPNLVHVGGPTGTLRATEAKAFASMEVARAYLAGFAEQRRRPTADIVDENSKQFSVHLGALVPTPRECVIAHLQLAGEGKAAAINITGWLATAPATQIIEAALKDFGTSVASDSVTKHYSGINEVVADLVARKEKARGRPEISCKIHADFALRWLLKNRQDVGINVAHALNPGGIGSLAREEKGDEYENMTLGQRELCQSEVIVSSFGGGAEFSHRAHLLAHIQRNNAHLLETDDLVTDDGIAATIAAITQRRRDAIKTPRAKMR